MDTKKQTGLTKWLMSKPSKRIVEVNGPSVSIKEPAAQADDEESSSSESDNDVEVHRASGNDSGPPAKVFKTRSYGFQEEWLKDYTWLVLNEERSKLLCKLCKKAYEMNVLPPKIKVRNKCFISDGFSSWNVAIKKFDGHEKSKLHKTATEILLPKVTQPIAPFIKGNLAKSQQVARVVLEAIITSLQFLAKQGLAIRGHENDDGNFKNLLKLRSNDIPELQDWLKRKSAFYTSVDIQNDIISIMALQQQRKILNEIRTNGKFCLIVDETSDLSGNEQVSICLRSVTKDLVPQEYFLGLYEVHSTTSENLTTVILKFLKRSGLSIESLRGHCYDGARNMSGVHKGVARRISDMQPLAPFIHCYAHSLNLAIQDTVKTVPLVRDTLAVVHEISVLVKPSPKRLSQFKTIVSQHDGSSGIVPKPMCPTRFLYRARSIRAIVENYGPLLEQLKEIAASHESASATAHGLSCQLRKGEVYFVMVLCLERMVYLESLSRQIQKPTGTLCGILESVASIKNVLHGHSHDESVFRICFEKMEAQVKKYELDYPKLPRHRKPTAKTQKQAPTVFKSVEDYLLSIYQSVYKMAEDELNYRFSQDGVSKYDQMENLLINSIEKVCGEQIQELCDKYNLKFDRVLMNLNMLKFSGKKFESIISLRDYIQSLHPETRELYSEVIKILKLLLLFPVSSCTPERSFSAMKRIKNYLRTTMGQQRLNHCLILNLYSDLTDEIDVNGVIEEFINNEKRMCTFGK